MPPLSELNDYYLALRAHYAGKSGGGRSLDRDFPPDALRFEKMLLILAGGSRALQNLRLLAGDHGLTPAAVEALPGRALEDALRPAGLAGQKASRVRALAGLLEQMAGQAQQPGAAEDPELAFLDACEPEDFKRRLLALPGIGPESADAIMLFVLDYPVFAVNARIWRVLRRHGFAGAEAGYEELRDLFMAALPEDSALFRDYHGLLQALAADFCKNSKSLCLACPLGPYMEYEACE